MVWVSSSCRRWPRHSHADGKSAPKKRTELLYLQHPQPIISMQATLKGDEISTGNSLMMFAQSLFTSILIVVGNTILDESLRSEIPKYAPNVDLDKVIAAGATGYRSVVGADDLSGVIMAYAKSLDKVFYIGAASATLAFLIAPGMGWTDIRKKGPKVKETSGEAGETSGDAV